MRPVLVLKPTTPLKAAGMRTDPPVSEPMAQGTRRALRPPRRYPRRSRPASAASCGRWEFTGVPKCGS